MKKLSIKGILVGTLLILGSIGAYGKGYNGEVIAPNSKITVDYRNADLVTVLRTLSYNNNLNLVVDENIKGIVTVSVENVLVDDFLEAILRNNGYTYVKNGNLVEVVSIADAENIIAKSTNKSRVYKLKTVQAEDIESSVKELLTSGKAVANGESNTITVIGSNAEVEGVDKFIESIDNGDIDSSRKNVELIRTKHYSPEIIYQTLSDMNYRIAGDIKVSDDLGGLLVIASDEDVSKLKAVIEKIDVPKHQVVIEARIIEVSEGTGRDYGIGWSYNQDNGQDNRSSADDSGDGSLNPIGGVDSFIDASNIGSGISIGLGLLGNDQFTALYRNIVTESSTEILAKPTVTTLDGEEATIDLVEEVPYRVLDYISESGDASSSAYEFKEVGVSLKVTPEISEDGMISMEVAPSISEVTSFTDDGIPVISRRDVETSVIVRNGQTLAIGGLIRSTATSSVTKNPVLSKIPLIGYFFTNESKSQNKTNLMIFLTPKLILNRDLEDRVNLVEGSGSQAKKTIKLNELRRRETVEIPKVDDTPSEPLEESIGINRLQGELKNLKNGG